MPSSGPDPGHGASLSAALALTALALIEGVVADEPPIDRSRSASIWEGVYSRAQAERGLAAFTGPCSHCHGYKLDGAPDDPDMFPTPPLAGAKFLRDWDGRSLAALYEYTRARMPENNPGYLSDQDYADIVAYMLSVSGVPAGEQELGTEQRHLSRVIIQQSP